MISKVKRFRRAFFDTIPIFFGYFFLGIVWGVLWEQTELPAIWAPIFSFFVYAGATQFLAFPFILAGGPPVAMLLTVIPVALRNSFYTVAMIDRLPTKWYLRWLSVFTLVDAPFALLISRSDEECKDVWYSIPLLCLPYLYWVLGSFAGIWTGGLIPDEFDALDFALPALIAALMYDQLYKMGRWTPFIIACVSSAVSRYLFGHDWLFPAIAICSVSILAKGDS